MCIIVLFYFVEILELQEVQAGENTITTENFESLKSSNSETDVESKEHSWYLQ